MLENSSEISVTVPWEKGHKCLQELGWSSSMRSWHSCPLPWKSHHISVPHPKTQQSWGQTLGKKSSDVTSKALQSPFLTRGRIFLHPILLLPKYTHSIQTQGPMADPGVSPGPPAIPLSPARPPHSRESRAASSRILSPFPLSLLPAPLPISQQRLETGEEFKVITITF